MQKPFVTFVMYARNDGYTADFISRMRLSINVLTAQARRFEVLIEILIVEWNPPPEQPALSSALAPIDTGQFTTIKIITVPPEEHTRCRLASAKGMHPARALNVGYRRASGDFVTPKSADSFLSDQVFSYLSTQALDTNKLYRLNRYDIDPAALDGISSAIKNAAPLPDFADHIKRGHTPQDNTLSRPLGLPLLHTNAAGDFMLMGRDRWNELRGQPEDTDVLCLDTDSITLHAAITHNLTEVRLPDDCRLFKPVHGNMSNSRVALVWSPYARAVSAVARLISRSPATQARLRGLFDVPKRQLTGIGGTHVSFEKNFYLKVRRWALGQVAVVLNGPDWGLGNRNLALKELNSEGENDD